MIANTPEAWSERAAKQTSHEAALWSARGQHERFVAVVALLAPTSGETLLDYGCGTGAFSEFLPDDVDYVGYDWAPGMIDRARRDHPSAAFVNTPPAWDFDLTVCIGPFNLPDGWNKELTWATLQALWRRTRRTLVASLYAGDDPDCLSYTENELRALELDGLPTKWLVRHRPNDLLLAIYSR